MLTQIKTVKSSDPQNVQCDCGHRLSRHKLFIDTEDLNPLVSGECMTCSCKEISFDFGSLDI